MLWCKGTQPSLFTHSLSSDCLLLLLLAPRVGRVVVSRGESCEAHHDTTSIATGLTPFLLGIAPTSNSTSPCRGHVPGVPCQTRTSHSVKPVEMVQPYSFTIVVPAPCLSLSHPPPPPPLPPVQLEARSHPRMCQRWLMQHHRRSCRHLRPMMPCLPLAVRCPHSHPQHTYVPLCASLCVCGFLLLTLWLWLWMCYDGVMAGPSRLWSFLIRKDYSQEVALGSVEQCGMTGTGWTVELWVKVRAKP